MKALVINSFFKPDIGGGAELTIESIYAPLAASGIEIVLLATIGSGERRVEVIDGIKVIRVPIANIYWHLRGKKAPKLIRLLWHFLDTYNLRMGKHVRETIRAEQPDIVIFHNLSGWSISASIAAIRSGVPTLMVLHDSYLLCRSALMFKNGHACVRQCATCRLARLPHRLASNRIGGVIGVSNYILDRFRRERYFSAAKTRTIHNARAIPDSPRSRNGASNSELAFGFIGTIMPAKGVSWLVDQFRKKKIENRLLIAGYGDPEYIARLKQLGRGLNIDFLGYADSESFYAQIDVCIVPSIWPDTFPGVAFEACAYHVPVIASNRGGLPEIIKDGVNGLLCDPDEPDSLGLAVDRLRNDQNLYKSLQANARQAVQEMIDPARMINAHREFIQLISGKQT